MENKTIYASDTLKVAGSPVLIDLWTGEAVGTLNSLYRFKSDNNKTIEELVKREFNATFNKS